MLNIRPQYITATAFAPFGEVLDCAGSALPINEGACDRFHDLAQIDILDGTPGISLFRAQARSLPYEFDLLERHPKGSQAFIPMSMEPFLVIVAKDLGGKPDTPQAFVTHPGQGINFHRNTWHGVLTPLAEPGLFAVIDRIGSGLNLEEYRFPNPILVQLLAQ